MTFPHPPDGEVWSPYNLPGLFIHLAASGCLLLWMSTRLMGHLQNRRVKHPLLYALAALMFMAGLYSGVRFGRTAWTSIPAVVLVAAIVFEMRHAMFRRRHRIPPLPAVHALQRLRRPICSVHPAILRHRVELPAWQGRPFHVIHLSDLHIDRWFPDEWFAGTVRQLASVKPDLIFVTGDTVNKEQYIERAVGLLKPLTAIAPSYAVLGNHDFWMGADAAADCLRRSGFDVLRNETREVKVGGGILLVSGSEDPWNDTLWRPPTDARRPLLVLAHTADGFQKLRMAGADIVFSGHYHAGQVRVPVLGPLLMPSVHGRRFDHGHFVVDGAHVLVSAGLGTEYPPPRILCNPDVFDVEVVGTERIGGKGRVGATTKCPPTPDGSGAACAKCAKEEKRLLMAGQESLLLGI